jgi:COP9 signalosome complex subunit 4
MDALAAERLVARMISEERLRGILDQTEGLLLFNHDVEQASSLNEDVKNICRDLTQCVDIVKEKYSDSLVL